MLQEHTDLIFENYEKFLGDYSRDLGSPAGVLEMLSSQGSFDAYIQSLTDGMPKQQKVIAEAVCRREREVLLEEATQIGPSAGAISYAISFFPILTDIYSDPVISQVCTVYPYDKPTLTIPRLRTKATVTRINGTSDTSMFIPRTKSFARALDTEIVLGDGAAIVSATPATAGNNSFTSNLFTVVCTAFADSTSGAGPIAAVTNANGCVSTSGAIVGDVNEITVNKVKITSHTFYISKFKVSDGTATISIDANIYPDARGQLKGSIEFVGVTGADAAKTIVLDVIGNINIETGQVQLGLRFSGKTAAIALTYKTVFATASVSFNATRGNVGRVKVDLEQSAKDYSIDVREDFEIGLFTERMQDYKAIYNIDLVRTLSDVIKQQMLLNKDYDLARYLKQNEADMKANGAFATLDLARYDDRGEFTPSNILDVFKSIIPVISMVSRKIKMNYRAEPQYLLAGQQVAVILEALQQYGANWSDSEHGVAGFAAGMTGMSFRKMTVLSSPVIPDDMVYMIYKAPGDDLGRSTIVDITYKPLYIIEELTNTEKRTFVRSRSIMDVVNPDGLGAIKITDTAGASVAGGMKYLGDFS